jgi:hypothetical protein
MRPNSIKTHGDRIAGFVAETDVYAHLNSPHVYKASFLLAHFTFSLLHFDEQNG